MGNVVSDLSPYDAVLLLSFGGPDAPEEVMPFLRNVTAGRGIPPQRLTAVAEHYLARGGRSPGQALRRLKPVARGALTRARSPPHIRAGVG